jgi:hypothetical protein
LGGRVPCPASCRKGAQGPARRFGVTFERIHDLEALAERLPSPARHVFDADELARLTPWAAHGRYGIEEVGFTRQDVAGLVDVAERVVATARDLIRSL